MRCTAADEHFRFHNVSKDAAAPRGSGIGNDLGPLAAPVAEEFVDGGGDVARPVPCPMAETMEGCFLASDRAEP